MASGTPASCNGTRVIPEKGPLRRAFSFPIARYGDERESGVSFRDDVYQFDAQGLVDTKTA